MSGTSFNVLGVAFEKALVNFTLDVDVDVDRRPVLIFDHFDDALKVCGIGNLVLGLAKDDAEQTGFPTKGFRSAAVVVLQVASPSC